MKSLRTPAEPISLGTAKSWTTSLAESHGHLDTLAEILEPTRSRPAQVPSTPGTEETSVQQ